MGMGNNSKNVQVAQGGSVEDVEKKRDTETPLASQSLLLLLVLTNHWTASNNPYRDALFSFTNVEGLCLLFLVIGLLIKSTVYELE